jgi:glutaredoxin
MEHRQPSADGARAARPKAVLYRMVTPEHICPFGLKSRDLLEREGFTVEDHLLRSRKATDDFMAEQHVRTTPQTFIEGERVGGYDRLRAHFGKTVPDPEAPSYQPVIAVFGMALLMAAAAKLRDLEGFSNMFLGYDLLAQRWVRYAYLYPFGEAVAGVLMIAGILAWIAAPIAIFIGSVGAVSVVKAVHIDRRELKCSCVGGDSRVPLGFISLTENLMMVAMGIWTAVQALAH